MVDVDAGGGDRLALGVLAQYRMATTEQMHRLIAPGVRIERTRRRLAKLRQEGLVDRITLPQAGRTRVWFATAYGVEVVSEWPELREWRPAKLGADRTAARLRVGHALTVTETGLAFVADARRCGDVCRPLDWIPEVYHPLGGGEAVIPDALVYYRQDRRGGEGWSMLRAFVEVDRATMGPERLAAKIRAYERLFTYVPVAVGQPRAVRARQEEDWRRRYPVFPRLLFVLDATGPAGVENRITALTASARLTGPAFRDTVPIYAASLTDLLRNGPSAPVWRPVTAPGQHVNWTHQVGA
ncbi:replication-relaxation family protein [Streptomyces sp. NPDC051913]|uniref:replication-relaxation family protein n=1 Tax=Streptomyces sp. NPDC051913 TaxID=3365676 RepID=UPI0037D08E0B